MAATWISVIIDAISIVRRAHRRDSGHDRLVDGLGRQIDHHRATPGRQPGFFRRNRDAIGMATVSAVITAPITGVIGFLLWKLT